MLGDFHVQLAELMGNQVLAQMLAQLIARCALITLMYQSSREARHSNAEHVQLVKALAAHDGDGAARLMAEHLAHVESNLRFEQTVPRNDISMALN